MDNYNPIKLTHEYMRLQSGDIRLRSIRQACVYAQKAGDTENAIKFHHDYIKESVFSGDRYRALIDFPQYLALLDKDVQIKEKHAWQTLWMFKWILEAAYEFYQIPKKQVYRWFEEFRSESLRNGHSLKAYYDKKSIFDKFCDPAKARIDYLNYLKCPSDSLSDGDASDLDTIIQNELMFGNYNKADITARKIFDENMSTEEIPAKTYSYFLEYHMARGELAEADKYVRLLIPYCIGSRFRLEQTGFILCYFSLTDVEEGLDFYKKQYHLRVNSKNPYLCFCFDNGAARIFRSASSTNKLVSDYANGFTSFDQAADYYMNNCRKSAELFDLRNESSYFMSRCNFEGRYGNV